MTDEGYVGIDVHRASRIAGVAHGGQIVLSERTRVVADAGAVTDLGRHRLKDLAEAERLFQIGDESFPPLRSLNATNLPIQPEPLIGRARELADTLALLETARLVTLTGAGGSGKTRLALQAAAELVQQACRALDVGEEEGDGAGRELAHLSRAANASETASSMDSNLPSARRASNRSSARRERSSRSTWSATARAYVSRFRRRSSHKRSA